MDRTAVRPSTARPVSRRHENLYRQPTRRNHQVNINGGLDAVVAKRLADHGSNGQVGHVVVVHDVKVNHVGARFQDIVDFRTEFGEIGRQNGGGNEVVLISPDIQGSARPSGGLLLVEKVGREREFDSEKDDVTRNFGQNMRSRFLSTGDSAVRTGAVKAAPVAAKASKAQAVNFILMALEYKQRNESRLNEHRPQRTTNDRAFTFSQNRRQRR
jgi:hypothetical protein